VRNQNCDRKLFCKQLMDCKFIVRHVL